MYPSQIRQWRRNKERLEDTVKRNPRARAISVGRPLHAPALENKVAAWILHRRGLDIAVSTRHVISKALSIDPTFKEGDRKRLRHWVYPFVQRKRLSIRRRTHVGQKLSGHLQSVRNDFVEMVNERFRPGGTLEGTPPSMIVNMDEMAVHYELQLLHLLAAAV
ncbi:Tc5 transposase DNA-binding domain [Phytophthora infestans]|uniref:Tc5 transposase DNA-binding domain n=1 Tax=Phytophthora infestans TaxID=4787 RepID=A0A833T4Y0_PHYIN|nr:Tc5 transposase DNA-binding domain [Phytophthora infestans]